eukprot:COSAG02_NODE_42777_length_381_cov_0.921986_2_plen_33_part_01
MIVNLQTISRIAHDDDQPWSSSAGVSLLISAVA